MPKLPALLTAALGGVLGTLADVLTLVVLVEVGHVAIPFAAFLAAGIGAVTCFALSKYVAFADHSPLRFSQIARFSVVAVTTSLLMAAAMKLVAVDHQVPYLAAKLMCAALIFLVWSYPAQRWLVFAPRPAPLS